MPELLMVNTPPAQTSWLDDLVGSAWVSMVESVVLAPIDDEPLTPDDQAALREARDAARRGDVTPHEDVRRELGL